MPLIEVKIAELLCTRLCHDLTGPIGAVNNGAEFLKEEGFDMPGQAVDLIVSSAQEAVSRLQFYRKAYGRINDDGEASLAENKKIVEDFFRSTKITLDWPDTHTDAAGASVSRKLARLLLNMIIIATGVLIRGGNIAIRVQPGEPNTTHDISITLTATGTSVKWDKDIEAMLKPGANTDALTPKTVQPYLTQIFATEIAVDLAWNVTDERCELVARHRISA